MHLDAGTLVQVLPNPIRVQDALPHASMHVIMVVRTHASKAALTPAKDRHQVPVPIATMRVPMIASILVPVHVAMLAVADVEVIVLEFVADLVVTHVAAIAQVSVMALVAMLAVLVVAQVVPENAVVHVVTRAVVIARVSVKALVEMHAATDVVQVVLDNVVAHAVVVVAMIALKHAVAHAEPLAAMAVETDVLDNALQPVPRIAEMIATILALMDAAAGAQANVHRPARPIAKTHAPLTAKERQRGSAILVANNATNIVPTIVLIHAMTYAKPPVKLYAMVIAMVHVQAHLKADALHVMERVLDTVATFVH